MLHDHFLKYIREKINTLISKHNTPGTSIAIIENFRIKDLLNSGFLSKEGKRKVDKNTLFQAASISKFLTALIIIKLVEKRKLKLGDNVNTFLGEFKVTNKGGVIKQITIEQLLSHTGGLSCSGFRGYEYGKEVPDINQILYSKRPSNNERIFVKYRQGVFHYSGGGYVILQKIIENITGQKFEDIAKKEIFIPLKMRKSTFNNPKSIYFAVGHEKGRKLKNGFFIYPEKAAAGLWTTAEDLAKLIIEFQLSNIGQSEKILSKIAIHKMLTPMSKVDNNFVGLGIFISKNRDVFYHAGSNMGYRSKFIADLKGNGIVILTNSSKGYDFINDLLSNRRHT